jgi:hypothetical protein
MFCPDVILNVLTGRVAVILTPSTAIVLKAGIPPKEEGTAQKVPPSPSLVRVCRAGIMEFVEV